MYRLLWLLNIPFSWSIWLSVTAVMIVVAVVAQLIAWPFDPDRRVSLWVTQAFFGRLIFAAEPFLRVRRTLPPNLGPGPFIVVANHNSIIDIPLIMGLPFPLRVVAKAPLMDVPVMGWYMRFSGQIAMHTGSPEAVASSLQACLDSLNAGISLLIFPEGTRSLDGNLLRFRRGAFRLSKDTGVPILPVVITGAGALLPKQVLIPQLIVPKLGVRALDPVDPADFSTARAMSNRVRAAMDHALEEARG
ncbi:MAG: 1-acyl-sn-glycerol-3-phosphate acyltransferase [Alphaproteobacteria bacterium]|nr:1-acyl-sn-glycerol-3-phosphate acyltransferase [Alphaproteobacteria bacterium]